MFVFRSTQYLKLTQARNQEYLWLGAQAAASRTHIGPAAPSSGRPPTLSPRDAHEADAVGVEAHQEARRVAAREEDLHHVESLYVCSPS